MNITTADSSVKSGLKWVGDNLGLGVPNGEVCIRAERNGKAVYLTVQETLKRLDEFSVYARARIMGGIRMQEAIVGCSYQGGLCHATARYDRG